MFADNSLMPKEAVRLTALGLLADRPMSYSVLADEVRHFTGRIMGPSLELMGTSIELLRYEGLVEAGDDDTLRLTAKGRETLHTLLAANIRAPANDLNKLVTALKFRFLHLLEPGEQSAQLDLMIDKWESELARIEDLRAHHGPEGGLLIEWLDTDIQRLESRLAWLKEVQARPDAS